MAEGKIARSHTGVASTSRSDRGGCVASQRKGGANLPAECKWCPSNRDTTCEKGGKMRVMSENQGHHLHLPADNPKLLRYLML